MFEELVDTVFPGGAFLAVGVALGAAFSRQLRPVAKEAIKAGMNVANQVQSAAAEAYERGQDLVAEARYEHETTNGHHAAAAPTTSTQTTARPAASARRRTAES